jgi:two-component SAPR family response regulator
MSQEHNAPNTFTGRRLANFVAETDMIKTFQPIKTASRRTINRIKENGPTFEIKEWSANVSCFEGKGGWLVKSNKNDWIGWLPESEVMVIS